MDWSGFEPEASGLQNRRSSGLIYQPTAGEGGLSVLDFRSGFRSTRDGSGAGTIGRAHRRLAGSPRQTPSTRSESTTA